MDNKEAHDLLMQWPDFAKKFLSESDRFAVLIASSLLDDLLRRILKAYFVPGNISKDLFDGGNAALGTFSSRINLSYALGLINKNEYYDLKGIKKIRNYFAHEWDDYLDLEHKELSQICRSMHNIRTDILPKNQTPRECFNTVIGVLFAQFSHRALNTSHLKERVEKDCF